MTFDHDTGLYNVEGSLVAWLQVQLTTNRPPLITTVRLNLNAPEQVINPPEWSVHFLGYTESDQTYTGGQVGDSLKGNIVYGLMEVNCWVSRQDTNWRAQLNQMMDAVTKAVKSTTAVIVRDFYASSSAPPTLNYRIVLDGAEIRNPPVDPNPDIERRRVLIRFFWVERA